MASPLKLKYHLWFNYNAAILDLEGTIPSDIVLQVKRGTTDCTRPMNILTDGSLFDIPYAFSTGLLKLIDLESNKQVDLAFLANSPKSTAKSAIITVPPRKTPTLRLFEWDLEIPLQLRTHLAPALVLGHEYRVELDIVDLGVKWWNYGDEADPTLPSEPANLIAMRSTHRDFKVVKPLPKPPSISVSMSLSSNILHRSKSPPTTIRLAIVNQGDSAITVRSSRDQGYLNPQVGAENPPNIPRITSIEPSPSLGNFSITKTSTGKEFITEPKHPGIAAFGSIERSKGCFTTLEPNVPIIREFVLFERADAIIEAMGNNDDDEFCLRLRPMGAWWSNGTLEEIFGDQERIQRLPGGPCLPVILQSDDELQFHLED